MNQELLAHLRRTRGMRRSRHYTQKTPIHGRIVDAVPISERPASRIGRCLVTGKATCCSVEHIATLVEQHTRYVMLVKLMDNDSYTVAAALARHARTLPQELYKSLTWDCGSEMAGHKRFILDTSIQVYFCDPQNPWQRGTNENTNGLLRQYLRKGMNVSCYSQEELDAIARKLNERPRKTLGFRTPDEMFNECVASTV